jgi:hypothetical protein
MIVESVQNIRNGRGNGGGLFACRWEAVGKIKMVKMASQFPALEASSSPRNRCSTLQTSITYAKWSPTFGGSGSFGKSRIKQEKATLP